MLRIMMIMIENNNNDNNQNNNINNNADDDDNPNYNSCDDRSKNSDGERQGNKAKPSELEINELLAVSISLLVAFPD